jgi:hypothetical protein
MIATAPTGQFKIADSAASETRTTASATPTAAPRGLTFGSIFWAVVLANLSTALIVGLAYSVKW